MLNALTLDFLVISDARQYWPDKIEILTFYLSVLVDVLISPIFTFVYFCHPLTLKISLKIFCFDSAIRINC